MGIPFKNLPASVQDRIRQAKQPTGKYKVSPADQRRWNGRTYDSKAEMEYAKYLIGMVGKGDIIEVIEQPRVTLVAGFDYRPDFLVITNGSAYYVDVKGAETQRFRDVVRMWKQHGRLDLEIVKKKGKHFVHTDTIRKSA